MPPRTPAGGLVSLAAVVAHRAGAFTEDSAMRPMFATAHPRLTPSGGLPCPPLAAIRRAVAYPAVPARLGEGGTAPAAIAEPDDVAEGMVA